MVRVVKSLLRWSKFFFQLGNYRGIMLLEVAYKIVAHVVLALTSIIRDSTVDPCDRSK